MPRRPPEEILSPKMTIPLLWLSVFVNSNSFAAVPARFEADLSEAQLALYQKDYPKASTLVDSVLRESPNLPEAQELKAQILAGKNDRAAIAQFDRLIEMRKREGKTKEVGQYEFMAGRAAYRAKDVTTAVTRFTRAAQDPASAGSANYYLGLIATEQGKEEDARGYFMRALSSDNEDIKPAAQFQLSQLDIRANKSEAAVRGLVQARGLASTRLNMRGSSAAAKDLANQIQKATGKELHSLDESALLVNAGLMTGYDSNVLSVPTGTTSGSSIPSASSVVETLNYGIIYATSPSSEFQFVPSYRGSFNYNFNADTRNAQFLMNDVRVNITRYTLERTSYGLKLGGVMGFQYQVDPDTNNGQLGAFSLQGSFGPYLKTPLTDEWTLTADLYFQPKRMYLDDSFSTTLRESGWEQYARAAVVATNTTTYWNPGISVTGWWTQTSGEEFRGRKVSLDFGNTFYFSRNWIAGVSAGINAAWYPDRLNGIRRDQGITGIASTGYQLTDEFNILASLSYTGNFSNVSAYRYNRFIAAVGGNYAF